VGFDVTDQLQAQCLHFSHQILCQLFVDFKKAYDSVRKEAFFTILTEFAVHVKLVRATEIKWDTTASGLH
jgi:hypothetical protein